MDRLPIPVAPGRPLRARGKWQIPSPLASPPFSVAASARRKRDTVNPRLDGVEVARPELAVGGEAGEHQDLIGEGRERDFLLVGKLVPRCKELHDRDRLFL